MIVRSRTAKSVYLLCLAFMLGLASLTLITGKAAASSPFHYSYDAAPTETVGVTKPTISFYFNTNMTAAADSYEMFINGEKVPAIYDHTRTSYLYTPDKDLAPGNYMVRIVISYSGYVPIEQLWSFTVSSNAIKQFPAATREQLDGLAAVNDYRVLYGLPPVTINEKLNAGAAAHAGYLHTHNVSQSEDDDESLHDENPAKPGFTGKKPADRAAFYNYLHAVGEDAALYDGTINETVDALFDAPYHRSPFLNPDVKEIGIGRAGDYLVIKFGMEQKKAPMLIVSPAEGDRNVPTSFDGHESPDPLRIHANGTFPVGYPIMAEYYGSDIDQVKLLIADIQDLSSKKSIDFWLNTPVNDDALSTAFILMPRKPLQPNTSYRVILQLQLIKTDGSTNMHMKEWDFTTEPLSTFGKTKLHKNAADYKKHFVSATPLQRTASFGLNDRSYWVDGVSFPMTRAPAVVDGSSYLYIRDLAAALGASVSWDSAQQAAVYTKGTMQVTLYTAKNEIKVNGEIRQTDTPAKLIDEYTMVPVRLLAEVLGAKVSYLENAHTVKITY